jgi:hypothetical protein
VNCREGKERRKGESTASPVGGSSQQMIIEEERK